MTDPRPDFEERLSDALAYGAARAPSAAGLAAAAHTRRRRRRRAQLAVAGAVVALAAAAVPVVSLARGGGSGPDPAEHGGHTVAVDTQGAGELDLRRWETWHDVTIRVPDGWTYGSLADWCADGGSVSQIRVQRPETLALSILCEPVSGYGVTFSLAPEGAEVIWPVAPQRSDSWPLGAYVGARTVNGVVVTVVTDLATEAQAVLDSARPVDGVDPNGCAPRQEVRPEPPASGSMSVCRYDAEGDLEQSELLGDISGAAAASALEAASPGDVDCRPSPAPTETIRMRNALLDVGIGLDGACTVIAGSMTGLATFNVLYWALSPGWTGDATGLPLPAKLRQARPEGYLATQPSGG